MRRLIVLLLVTAGAASAQTDADLLDRLLAATQPAAAGVLPFGQLATDLAPTALQAVTDSTRARFLADWQPDHVREAVAALERPALVRVAARMAQRPSAGEVAELAFVIGKGTAADASAADSSVAGPYLRATGRSEATLSLVERALRVAAERFPEARADLDRRGQTLDEAIATSRTELAEMLGPFDLATVRLQLAGLAPADVKAATAFERTAAGRYVRATINEGTARALLPQILDLIQSNIVDAPPASTAVLPAPPKVSSMPLRYAPYKGL